MSEFDGYIKLRSAMQTNDGEMYGVPQEEYAPVVHGKWAFQYSSTDPEPFYSFCSHCRESIKSTRSYKIYKFCPHCGAIMDGVK